MVRLVSVIVGSKSDLEVMGGCFSALTFIGIGFDKTVASCHRDRQALDDCLDQIRAEGTVKVVILGAGCAAQLGGHAAARLKGSGIACIGVALPSQEFPNALDALLAMTRMPSGVPLVCAGIGKAGATNAALVAGEILVACSSLDQAKLQQWYVAAAEAKPPKIRVSGD